MKRFYTQEEVAQILRCSKGTIIEWSKDGYFDVWRGPRNGRVLYTIKSVDRFYEEHLEKGTKKVVKIAKEIPKQPESNFKIPTNIHLKRRRDGKEI